MFLVDSSGSIQDGDVRDWDRVLDFLRDTIRGLAGINNDVRFAVLTFSNDARLVYNFTAYSSVSEAANAVNTIPYIGGTTNIADAFRLARTSLVHQLRGGATSLLFLLTDGKPNERVSQTEPEADLMKQTGTRVFTIGVTRSIDEPQLRRIASNPTDVVTSPDFASLSSKVQDLVGMACGTTSTSPTSRKVQFCIKFIFIQE